MDAIWGELIKAGLPVLLMGLAVWWLAGRLKTNEERQVEQDKARQIAEDKEREAMLEMIKAKIKADIDLTASFNALKTLIEERLK